jgi:hypothetical protein
MSVEAIEIAFAGVVVTGLSVVANYFSGRADRLAPRSPEPFGVALAAPALTVGGFEKLQAGSRAARAA